MKLISKLLGVDNKAKNKASKTIPNEMFTLFSSITLVIYSQSRIGILFCSEQCLKSLKSCTGSDFKVEILEKQVDSLLQANKLAIKGNYRLGYFILKFCSNSPKETNSPLYFSRICEPNLK